jgi:hypothetical protein
MSTPASAVYEVVFHTRAGNERVHRYASDDPLEPGDILRLDGRFWIVEHVDQGAESPRALAWPARYRLRLHHPDGRDELGAFRRYRLGAPGVGHTFTTFEPGQPVSWEVLGEGLAYDEQGEPYLDLVAERDYGETDDPRDALPDHELEHALAAREEEEQELPEAATAMFSRAEEAGLSVELVALEPGELADWDEAQRYIDALVLEQIEDNLLELCGVDPDRDPRDRWVDIVKERLRADLAGLRADLDGGHDEIEEWDFLDGSIFAAVGNINDEANPDVGYGWLCRLVDSGALTVARFHRARKPEVLLSE